jgi:transcriptional regulator with GAF, ATPase, and Fis domain
VDELRTVVEAACVEAAAGEGLLVLTPRLRRLIGRPKPARHGKTEPRFAAAPRSRSELLAIMQEHDFVISRVAAHFGKHRQQVYRWMERFGIDPKQVRRPVPSGESR